MVERLVCKYIRDTIPNERQVHREQLAYREGLSTETAVYSAVTKIKEQLTAKECHRGPDEHWRLI